jgi:tryptophan-rich sensory protein
MRALVGFTVACLAVAGVGGAVTALSVDDWYKALTKPPFNPPDWVFAPVWTALYLLMAVAAWRVWRHRSSPERRSALVLFAIQLALNLLWSCVFFGLMAVGAALVEIVALWAAILGTAYKFIRIDLAAGWLMVPYAVWVSFAAVLNAAIWWLN